MKNELAFLAALSAFLTTAPAMAQSRTSARDSDEAAIILAQRNQGGTRNNAADESKAAPGDQDEEDDKRKKKGKRNERGGPGPDDKRGGPSDSQKPDAGRNVQDPNQKKTGGDDAKGPLSGGDRRQGDRNWKGDQRPDEKAKSPSRDGTPNVKIAPAPAQKAEPRPGEWSSQKKDRGPAAKEKKEERAARNKKRFEEMKKQRRESVQDGGKSIVIEEPDKRRIVRRGGRTTIWHDESERFRKLYPNARRERRGDNELTIIVRPGGIQIITEFDRYGRPLRRYRRGPDGREYVLFDNRRFYSRRGPGLIDAFVALIAAPVVGIPRERYIVDYDRASEDDIYDALSADPVDPLDDYYSLEEVRQTRYLRERMRRLDIDSITFDFGSWEVDPYEYEKLERLARIINRILARNPDEIFMIEGYTDAVGSDEDNLTLSDRRAEAVAEILTMEFDVPPENLVTQGYGEQFLKVDTQAPEPRNRFVAVRRVTPLIARD